MELKIDLEVQKVDNGFILFKDIYGIKLQDKPCESRQEIYVTFPEVRERIRELLCKIVSQLSERIPEKS